jgi:ubiquinone/menaquinone biosynthesis C-methylase UbiE
MPPVSQAPAEPVVTGEETSVARSARGVVRSGIDRTLSVGYGVFYDYIFERFAAYQKLRREVLALVEAGVPAGTDRSQVRVVDVNCGTGNFTISLAEAGFWALGVDPYAALIDLAREKRAARHLPNMAFQHSDFAVDHLFGAGSFDQVVNIHALYVHPDPLGVLARTHRVLKPGGHAVVVNFTRRLPLVATVRDASARGGLREALGCLLWVMPNALFEATRKPVGPHYWQEDEFARHLTVAGFTVLEMRRTFLNDASLLAWIRKDADAAGQRR